MPEVNLLKPWNGRVLFGAIALVMAASCTAQETEHWRLRAGPAALRFDSSAQLGLAGNTVPGASAQVKDNLTLVAEISYLFTPNWSLGLTLGWPPTTNLDGRGTASAFGQMGRAKYGPAVLTVQYQFDGSGGWRPYVGLGASYLKVFSTEDGAVSQLHVNDAWGSTAQVGIEYALGTNTSVFLDAKKLLLKTSASGYLMGAPVSADVKLNPLVLQAGLAWRF